AGLPAARRRAGPLPSAARRHRLDRLLVPDRAPRPVHPGPALPCPHLGPAGPHLIRSRGAAVPVRLIPGAKRRLLDVSPSAAEPWYINDHTLIRAADGRWHVFGSWHAEPAAPLDETSFVHASADDLEDADWTIHDPVLHARTGIGETHVWAPHVIAHDGRYWMFYAGGTADHTAYRITLATREDLFTWTPHEPVLFEDGYDARDPMVLRVGQRWLMYYTRTSSPQGGFHEVAV